MAIDPNIPEWMDDINPSTLQRIDEIAQTLIQQEGYSEEQAYQIALERGQEWEQLDTDVEKDLIDDELPDADTDPEVGAT